MAKHQFQTEVNQLLTLIIHSLYSNKDIFLREIVSNASDALDKLKFLTLSDEAYKEIEFDPRIDISFDEKEKTLTVADTGIGMDEKDLENNLGTIARSGTKSFLEKLSSEAKADSNLIGQFGVGFYSAFMVASKVEVLTRKAGTPDVWLWSSDGTNSYDLENVTEKEKDFMPHGSVIKMYLNKDDSVYASRWKIEELIKLYSDHITFPVYLHYEKNEYDDKGNVKSTENKVEKINTATALWQKPKSEIKPEDYKEFYKTLSHDTEDPLLYIHTKAEGTQEYITLFYVPAKAPFDMYHADYKSGVKLYVKRVFITDDDKELLPVYLRFVRGIIDSSDLPLNVSREILQQNRILASIKSASVKKILGEFANLAKSDKDKYLSFIKEYNRPLKEGLYSDFANRDTLLELVRFKTTKDNSLTSLAEYVERMPSDQKSIYYITGEDEKTLRSSPLLEAYKAKNIEVLIMDDEIDEIVISSVGNYKEYPFKAVNRSGADEDFKPEENKEKEEAFKPVVEKIKKALGDKVKDVRISKRLSDSPSCIVIDENDPSFQMEKMMRAMGGGMGNMPSVKPILEVNASHPILEGLQSAEDETLIEDISVVLLDQALLMEKSELEDPSDFVKRLNRLLSKK